MKKVLIIGYLWPYCRHQGGSPRTLGLVNYLAEFGWHPIVLTPPLSKEPRTLSIVQRPGIVTLHDLPPLDNALLKLLMQHLFHDFGVAAMFFTFGKNSFDYLVSTQTKV